MDDAQTERRQRLESRQRQRLALGQQHPACTAHHAAVRQRHGERSEHLADVGVVGDRGPDLRTGGATAQVHLQ
jgi:hypothetical protein